MASGKPLLRESRICICGGGIPKRRRGADRGRSLRTRSIKTAQQKAHPGNRVSRTEDTPLRIQDTGKGRRRGISKLQEGNCAVRSGRPEPGQQQTKAQSSQAHEAELARPPSPVPVARCDLATMYFRSFRNARSRVTCSLPARRCASWTSGGSGTPGTMVKRTPRPRTRRCRWGARVTTRARHASTTPLRRHTEATQRGETSNVLDDAGVRYRLSVAGKRNCTPQGGWWPEAGVSLILGRVRVLSPLYYSRSGCVELPFA